MPVEIIDFKPDVYLDAIKNNKPFSFSRFGDGEVICMFPNGMTENCDGSKFFPELQEPMKDIFRAQRKYFHAFLNCTFWESKDDFSRFIDDTCPNMAMVNGEVWQELSFIHRIPDLLLALMPHNPVFIGAEHLESILRMKCLDGIPGNIAFLTIPAVDAFLKIDYIISGILASYIQGRRMFCFSAGYSTKIIIDKLFPIIGHDAFMIDFGSVFDPYCGKLSRDGMQARGFEYFQQFTDKKLG